MAVWPVDLPDYVLRDGYQEEKMEGSIRTSMDQGPAKVRKRFTAIVQNINATIFLTEAQTEILDDFYENELGFGSLSFDWVHPRTQASVTFRFVKAPAYLPDGAAWRASMQLEILP